MLRFLIILLIVNFVIILFVLASRRPAKDKTLWSAILLGIPLLGLAIYHFLSHQKEGGPASLKDWEKQ